MHSGPRGATRPDDLSAAMASAKNREAASLVAGNAHAAVLLDREAMLPDENAAHLLLTVHLDQPLQEEVALTRGRPSVWPDSPSTPSREPSGSFPKSFSRLQWSRSSLVEFKPNFFTISGTVNLPNQHSIKSSSLIAIGYNCSLRPSFRGSVNAQPGKTCCQAIRPSTGQPAVEL